MPQINVLLFEGVEELDAVGPWEILSTWSLQHPEDGWSVAMITLDGAPVQAAKGLTLTPHYAAADAPAPEVLVYPGGIGTRALMRDDAHLEWLRVQASHTAVVASVCTGALVLAAAGLLRDRPATTHWASLELLAQLDPSIRVDADARWIDDGDIVTAAGVSAGIDMALGLVARFAGADRAREVRRYVQYDPQPPV
jgi:transcriptional regulator GlxA family with amidase domain